MLQEITIWHILIGIVIIVFLFLIEFNFPLRTRKYSFTLRLITNGFLSLLVLITVYFLVQPVQQSTLNFIEGNNFGLLYLIDLPPLAEGIIGFLLMDLAFYYWHLLNHKIPFLWRFHNVHHLDPDMDMTTAFRFHFGEIGFSSIFRIVQISFIGISPFVFIIYEFFFTANTVFHHSNIKLPIKFERILNRIIVTPRMHGIHHSQYKNETDSNYSTVFSWWDVVHRTIRLNVPQNKIVIGVPAYSNKEDNKLLKLITHPFKKQKDYWSKNNISFRNRENEQPKNKLHLIE